MGIEPGFVKLIRFDHWHVPSTLVPFLCMSLYRSLHGSVRRAWNSAAKQGSASTSFRSTETTLLSIILLSKKITC